MRGKRLGAACARVRNATQRFWLDGSPSHRIVDLLQGGKVVSVLCVVCGSYGGRVVQKSLLDKCPGTPPLEEAAGSCVTGCWVSCLVPSALYDSTVFQEKFCVPSLVHVGPGAHLLAFLPRLPFVAAALRDVLTSLRLTSPSLTFQSASLGSSPKLTMSRAAAPVVSTAGSAANDDASF